MTTTTIKLDEAADGSGDALDALVTHSEAYRIGVLIAKIGSIRHYALTGHSVGGEIIRLCDEALRFEREQTQRLSGTNDQASQLREMVAREGR